MLKNKTPVLQKFVLLCTVTVLLVSSANAQMLSLDHCLQIFTADSVALPALGIEKDFSTENLQPTTGLFVKQYRSKTDTRVSMMKVINTDTSRKQLVYNFRSNEQYKN
jgi:hypothetical protein